MCQLIGAKPSCSSGGFYLYMTTGIPHLHTQPLIHNSPMMTTGIPHLHTIINPQQSHDYNRDTTPTHTIINPQQSHDDNRDTTPTHTIINPQQYQYDTYPWEAIWRLFLFVSCPCNIKIILYLVLFHKREILFNYAHDTGTFSQTY